MLESPGTSVTVSCKSRIEYRLMLLNDTHSPKSDSTVLKGHNFSELIKCGLVHFHMQLRPATGNQRFMKLPVTLAPEFVIGYRTGFHPELDVRQSMMNGGGPACLRLRVVLTDEELAATNPAMRLTDDLYARLGDWADRWYRDTLSPADLSDPALLDESRGALDALTGILSLGGDFYPFQRA